jgi:predicted nucleotidyltransferase
MGRRFGRDHFDIALRGTGFEPAQNDAISQRLSAIFRVRLHLELLRRSFAAHRHALATARGPYNGIHQSRNQPASKHLMTQNERQAMFDTARDTVLATLPDAWAVYVYGSFARGEEWPDSDLDIAVLLPPEQRIPDLLELIGDISEHVQRDVDVVDLRRVGDVLRREVLENGRTLFESDPEKVLAWEASAMSQYARYREEVRDILDDFRRTGIGYGA